MTGETAMLAWIGLLRECVPPSLNRLATISPSLSIPPPHLRQCHRCRIYATFVDGALVDATFFDDAFVNATFVDGAFVDNAFLDGAFNEATFFDGAFIDAAFVNCTFVETTFDDGAFVAAAFVNVTFVDVF